MHVKTCCSNPACGQEYNLSTEYVGKSVRCKKCQQTFTVMESNDEVSRDLKAGTLESSVGSSPQMGTRSLAADMPHRLGRFEIRGKLGSGAFGFVYRAFDPQLEREVALKVPRPGTLDRKGAVQRFLREAKAAAQLRHPNIVPIYDAGRDGDQYYIASAFISGYPLEQAVSKGAMEPRRAAGLVRELAAAFEYAHGEGIIHRDIKPANVMLDEKDHPHVMDFGLARFDADDSKLTKDGAVMGTPSYMSPEQAMGQNDRVTATSDQYSLGVLFYELLTGQTPFSGPPHVVIVNVLKAPPPAPRSIRPDIPRDLETICLKAMAKEPELRYGSCREFAEDLRRWLAGEPITARRVSHAERLVRWCQRNRVVASLIATAALLLVAVAAISTVSAVRLKDLADRERNETKRANRETENAQRERTKALELAATNATLAEKEMSARDEAVLNAEEALSQANVAKRNLYSAHMHLAQSAWNDAQVGTVLELLERWRPHQAIAQSGPLGSPIAGGRRTTRDDLRGFEWYFWDRLCHSYLCELNGHSEAVSCVAYSPDGKRLASAGLDQTVRVWDAISGQELHTLKGHQTHVTSVTFSRDGKRLASASATVAIIASVASGGARVVKQGEVKVWDVARGLEMLTLKGGTCVAFSPDGKQLASARNEFDKPGEVLIWDTTSGQEVLTLKGHTGSVVSVAFSPDGQRVASAGGRGDNAVNVWKTTGGEQMLTLKGLTGAVNGVVFSDDGERLAAATGDFSGKGEVKVWNATSGHEMLTLNGHTGDVVSVAFSSTGNRIASGSRDQTVRVWDAKSGQEVLTLKGHTLDVTCVAFSPDGKQLASGSRDQTVKIWDTTRAQEVLNLNGHTGNVASVAFSSTGNQIVSGSHDQTVRVWDTACGKEAAICEGRAGIVTSVAFSPAGNLLASGNWDHTARLRDATSGQELHLLKGHTAPVTSVAFNSNGDRLASGSYDKMVKIWNSIDGKQALDLTEHTSFVYCVAFSRDGKRLASGSHDQTVKLWNATSGREITTLNGHAHNVVSVAFSEDGKHLASASWDQTVKIWDVAAAQEKLTIKVLGGPINGVAFSPDGKQLVSAHNNDKTVRVRDSTSGEETLKLKGHTSNVTCVVFCADGKRLVSASSDGTVKLWDARPWTPDLRVEQQAGSLIRFQFDKGLSKAGVLKAIAVDATISDVVRRRATELVSPLADNLTPSPSL